ncbi:hypothetical protein PRK78_001675 [Emydomyces testavorans]|uniref:EKC/KEOPS complex subunit BUD32 n=1 Tax=Emydomyces testavorans TaxID=2070801 RepID=A0AAF0DCW5_9EURO|nr:hypothetical protein PRK78_001675 [Emydomyces testavorans]
MTVSNSDFVDVGECGNSRYLWKDGKQVIITGSLSIDLNSLPLLDDTTMVDGETVTYEKRFPKCKTIPITETDNSFPNIPRIDYYSMQHGTWSECYPIEPIHLTEDTDTVFKLAAWKTKKVHRDAAFLSRLVTNDNIVRLLSIVTVEGRFAGYGMERLYELGTPFSPMKEQVKEMIPAFIQETVEYLHETAHVYHCDIRLDNVMVNGQGKLKLTDFDIAQTDVLATPESCLDDVQYFLGVSPRLDHLDINMSLLLIFKTLSDVPERDLYKNNRPADPLQAFSFYNSNNLSSSNYFHNVQEGIHRSLRAQMACELA